MYMTMFVYDVYDNYLIQFVCQCIYSVKTFNTSVQFPLTTKAERKPKSDRFHLCQSFYSVLIVRVCFIMKYSVLPKSDESIFDCLLCESHFGWECHCLSFFALCDVRGIYKASSLGSFEVPFYYCLEQLWSCPCVDKTRLKGHFSEKLPDICKVRDKLSLSSETFWKSSASRGRLRFTLCWADLLGKVCLQQEQCPRTSALTVWDATLQCLFKQNPMKFGLTESVG